MDNSNQISIIIRTMPGREKFLDKCLFILSGQRYKNIEPIIVVQKLNEEDSLNQIEAIVSEWKNYFPDIQLLHHTSAQDARSRSLNLGMQAVSGRYFAFLDDDDKVYPDHYANMIHHLQSHTNAWVYTDIVLATYDKNNQLISRKLPYKKDKYSFITHLRGNFIPIHGFVIDSYRAKDIGWIDETMDKAEDYEFLLRLAYKYQPLYLEISSAEYSMRSDGTNTVLSAGNSAEEMSLKKQQWQEAELKLNQSKVKNFGWWIRELESFSGNNMTSLSGEGLKSKEAKRELRNIHRSITWRFLRLFKKMNWKIRGRTKKRDIVPEDDSRAVAELLKIYSSKIWLIFSPLYAIERLIRGF